MIFFYKYRRFKGSANQLRLAGKRSFHSSEDEEEEEEEEEVEEEDSKKNPVDSTLWSMTPLTRQKTSMSTKWADRLLK